MASSGELLTPVEVKILRLIGRRSYGARQLEYKPTNRQIAHELGIGRHQVRSHIRNLNYKLGTAGRTHLAYKTARQRNLL